MTITALYPLIPTTPTGENAADILDGWSRWHERGVGVAPKLATVDALAPHVRTLIASGYETNAINYGLACWTITALGGRHDARLLPGLTHRYARDRSARARKWRAEMQGHVAAFGRGDLLALFQARQRHQEGLRHAG